MSSDIKSSFTVYKNLLKIFYTYMIIPIYSLITTSVIFMNIMYVNRYSKKGYVYVQLILIKQA